MKNMKKKLALLGAAITVSATIFAGQASAAASYETEVLYGVNFRAEPSVNSKIYRMLKKGEDIHVISQVNAYWLKVEDKNGRVGYISASAKYTDYKSSSPAQPQTKYATAKSGVNFRSAPKVADNKIGFISKGTSVEVLEQVNRYWLKIRYNGKIGYASTNYFNYTAPSGGSSPVQESPASPTASAIIATAKSYIGKLNYKWGAEPWNTNYVYTDCSAFVQLVYNKHHGLKLPRSSKDQAKVGTYVSKSNLKPGDLVFFDTNNDGVINHVGIYIGNGQFIHSSPANKVGIATVSTGYWSDRYETARRVL
jgi:cell wall-associated NlpC family hydrolase